MKTFSVWSAIIILSAAFAGILAVTNRGSQAQVLFVLWFLLVCPGMMLVRFFRLREPLVEWTLAVVLSLIMDTFIAGLLLMAGRWSPMDAFIIIVSVTVAGALAQEVIAFRTSSSQRRKA